jgi:hypothetical protein
MTIYEMVKDKPGFKAFCKRRSTARRLTSAERFKAAQKKFQSEFRAFCRRRGVLSILKENEYTTGHEYDRAQLKREKSGEFISVMVYVTTPKTDEAA